MLILGIKRKFFLLTMIMIMMIVAVVKLLVTYSVSLMSIRKISRPTLYTILKMDRLYYFQITLGIIFLYNGVFKNNFRTSIHFLFGSVFGFSFKMIIFF